MKTSTFKTMTLGRQLWTLGFLMMACLVGLGTMAHFQATKLMAELSKVTQVQMPASRQMTLADMMHDGLRGVAFEALVAVDAGDRDRAGELLKESEEKSKDFLDHIQQLKGIKLTAKTEEALKEVEPSILEYAEITQKLVRRAAEGDSKGAHALKKDFGKSFSLLEEKMETLGGLVDAEAALSASDGAAGLQILIWTVISAVVLGAFCTFLISKQITNRLKQIVGHLGEIVDQSLRTQYSVDEASVQVKNNATEQSAAIQESVASLTEISRMIETTTQSVDTTTQFAKVAQNASVEGQDVVLELEKAMEAISESNRELDKIRDLIQNISEKTGIINDIVFKTQLLSFNASIEAARAGQHGRGFAVVAEEVGSLASTSGSASKEIEALLNSAKTQVSDSLGKVIEKINSGNEVAQRAKAAFKEIVGATIEVSKKSESIKEASLQQEAAVQQSLVAMNQLETSGTKNRNCAEQMSTAVSDLKQEGELLSQSTEELSLMVGERFSVKRDNTPGTISAFSFKKKQGTSLKEAA